MGDRLMLEGEIFQSTPENSELLAHTLQLFAGQSLSERLVLGIGYWDCSGQVQALLPVAD